MSMSTANTDDANPDAAGAVTNQPNELAAKQLADHAAEIRTLGKRMAENVIEIGRRLTDCKRITGHGKWLPWLKSEFGWDERTAQRFMSAHELAGKYDNLSDLELPVSGLYLLAAPSTPEAAREEVFEQAMSGPVSHLQIKETINKH